MPPHSREAQDDGTPAVVYPGGTCGCVFIQTLLSPLAVARYGRRFRDNLHFKVQLYPRTTEKLAKITVWVLFVCFAYRNCGNTSSTSMREVKTEMLSSRIQPGVAKDTAEKDSAS